MHRMKYWKTAVSILAALSASLALAEDFKTTNGKEYKNATVTHVEADGIVLKTKTGISKVYFTELPKEVQERFLPSPAKTGAAQRELIELKSWVAAMANSTLGWVSYALLCGRYRPLTMFTRARRSFPPLTTTPRIKPTPRA